MSTEIRKFFQALEMKQFAPVYLVDGEETFYLDKIVDYFENNILASGEKDFNLQVLYAKDHDVKSILSACNRYPMFAERQVVILREAWQMRLTEFNELSRYVEKPTQTTILLIEHRFKKVDGRSKVIKSVKERGVYFTAEKLKDDAAVQSWITNYGKDLSFQIGPQEAEMLNVYLGNDLQKISNEIDKIRINVPDSGALTKELIARYIGISREYNALDFGDVIVEGNLDRLFKMMAYFSANPKSAPIPLLVGVLYNHFNRLYKLNFCRGKSDKDIAAALGMSPYFVRNALAHSQKWPLGRVEHALLVLAKYSRMSVGVDSYTNEDSELLKELVSQLID
jgi:DNA polymerase-3 subunit delta